MKVRRDITAAELEPLYERVDRLLERVGIETQPKVAAKLLSLIQAPDAQLSDYGEAIKTDVALTGRILKLANSAAYAQRSPVTKLDRALVLLGVERTKAVSLGFYMSRAATAADVRDLSRKVWGQSVYRATLAASLARILMPPVAAEAFVIGLMLDCGIPLMARLVGPGYMDLLAPAGGPPPSPSRLFALESEKLEFTHVDIAAALCRRWKLPPILAKPISWHHTPASIGRQTTPVLMLQRIAYYVGGIALGDDATPVETTPAPAVASELLRLSGEDVEKAVTQASKEYSGVVGVFSDVAASIGDLDSLAERVNLQMTEMMDAEIGRAIRMEARAGTGRFTISGQMIEVEPGTRGHVVAYLTATDGERLIACSVNPAEDSPGSIARMLGLDDAPPESLEDLMRVMRSMAA